MIVRIWHGKTKREYAVAYRQYVLETGIKEYLKVKGNKGAKYGKKMKEVLLIFGQYPGGKILMLLNCLHVKILKS